MTLKDLMKAQLKEAMKSKDSVALATIRGLLSEIQYAEMAAPGESISDKEVVSLLQREVKKRKESIEFANKANRADEVATLNQELSLIGTFLPTPLTSVELHSAIEQFLMQSPTAKLSEVMKYLKEHFDGRFDAKEASGLVNQKLS
jgi:uncharacterized protein